MTFYFKLENNAYDAYLAMIEVLKARAQRALGLDMSDIIVRSLRPEDVGLATPEWVFNITDATWNTLVNVQLSDQRFIGINGLVYAESGAQAVSQVKITRMGQDKRLWQTQGINFLENSAIFVDDPVLCDQNTNLTITGYGVADSVDEHIVFMGVVAEKRGLLLR